MHKIDVLNNLPDHLQKQCIAHWKRVCVEEGLEIRIAKVSDSKKSWFYNVCEWIWAVIVAVAGIFLVGILISL